MRIDSMKVLGQAIRARRKELGYSQQQMADYCGCGTRFISDLENGKETIQFGKALGVASMLGLDLSIDVRERGGRGQTQGCYVKGRWLVELMFVS